MIMTGNAKWVVLVFAFWMINLFNIFTPCVCMAETKIVYQNYDNNTVPPVNVEGLGYPQLMIGNQEGGNGTISLDTTTSKVKGGTKSIKFHITSGWDLYGQWNPYTGSSRDFAYKYIPGWVDNTYTHMRFWVFHASNSTPLHSDTGTPGGMNWYMGTYVKSRVRNNGSSDEDGGGHYYHPFDIVPGQWSKCVFNSHPGHRRGDAGGVDSGNLPYPTTSAYGGSGDPNNTYYYWDTLTRWYVNDLSYGYGGFPKTYWMDEIEFYREPYAENDYQVYGICASYTSSTNRLVLTWNHHKNDRSILHEVRYGFSNIHASGWANAIVAPSGVITPTGDDYNGMIYDTAAINVGTNQTIYLAIKPQNSSLFSQIAIPLTSGTSPPRYPNAPLIGGISP